jgi:hypothetical protein
VKNPCAKPVNPEEVLGNLRDPVEFSPFSPGAVPSGKPLGMRKAAVIPVVHTPYDYDKRF